MTVYSNPNITKKFVIRCRKCDRELGAYKDEDYPEVYDYDNIITFYCEKCGADMEINFK